MASLSTHVLDTSLGTPVPGLRVGLSRWSSDTDSGTGEIGLGERTTDDDGRIAAFGPDDLDPGSYVLRFDTGAYFARSGVRGFYPQVVVVFTVADGAEHHHVPVLLSPFGYSTYRGS